MLIKKTSIQEALHSYSTDYTVEAQYIHDIMAFVERVEVPHSRATLEGHLTASAWVLSPDQQAALLIHHRGLDRWFQPGGHIEPSDTSLSNASHREAIEETGQEGLRLAVNSIFDIDIHPIPGKGHIPKHLHYDVRYLFVAHSWNIAAQMTEVKAAKWVPLTEIQTIEQEGSLQRMAEKARQRYQP